MLCVFAGVARFVMVFVPRVGCCSCTVQNQRRFSRSLLHTRRQKFGTKVEAIFLPLSPVQPSIRRQHHPNIVSLASITVVFPRYPMNVCRRRGSSKRERTRSWSWRRKSRRRSGCSPPGTIALQASHETKHHTSTRTAHMRARVSSASMSRGISTTKVVTLSNDALLRFTPWRWSQQRSPVCSVGLLLRLIRCTLKLVPRG